MKKLFKKGVVLTKESSSNIKGGLTAAISYVLSKNGFAEKTDYASIDTAPEEKER